MLPQRVTALLHTLADASSLKVVGKLLLWSHVSVATLKCANFYSKFIQISKMSNAV